MHILWHLLIYNELKKVEYKKVIWKIVWQVDLICIRINEQLITRFVTI